ncbi:MAG: 2,3-bisphosphoglycerate-dependent phosphoglycerate mutase [bacterium]|nr:2,3-bisphosphoglycerate-dependent phosphoglycerate mutase [bacterium]
MSTLILLRHGQSIWNKSNRFTGWVDAGLSQKGVAEATVAGQKLRPYHFNRVFTSVLTRALDTTKIVLEVSNQNDVPVTTTSALNERHYGDLQGLNKAETIIKYGPEQVKLWRRSYTTRPPNGESLKDTIERVMPFYKKTIIPCLEHDQTILISAHGNSLRALIKQLEHLNENEIISLEIPTGIPIVYKLNDKGEILNKMILS